MKYLQVTNIGDFITYTKSPITVLKKDERIKKVMTYDADGIWIDYAEIVNGKPQKGFVCDDGRKRQYIIDFIKNNKAGTFIDDVENLR
jgi:hypothetical protein